MVWNDCSVHTWAKILNLGWTIYLFCLVFVLFRWCKSASANNVWKFGPRHIILICNMIVDKPGISHFQDRAFLHCKYIFRIFFRATSSFDVGYSTCSATREAKGTTHTNDLIEVSLAYHIRMCYCNYYKSVSLVIFKFGSVFRARELCSSLLIIFSSSSSLLYFNADPF